MLSVFLASKPAQAGAVAQSIGCLEGANPPWQPFSSPFLGEGVHLIRFSCVREEVSRFGRLFVPHGDLRGLRECVGWGARWSVRDCGALSFPASVLIGAVCDDGVPF